MANDTNPRKNILVVDDEVIQLEITKAQLKNDFNVYTVKSGQEALNFLNSNKIVPDLILLDILMPSMDGWIVFDRINDIAALEFTPIMFYTSLDEESAKEKAYELGAFDFITKPCDQAVLLSRIGETLKKAELRKKQYGI